MLDHLPGPGERLRCGACGNLTRFDVAASRRTTGFWHYTVAGELTVEDERDQVEAGQVAAGGAAQPLARAGQVVEHASSWRALDEVRRQG